MAIDSSPHAKLDRIHRGGLARGLRARLTLTFGGLTLLAVVAFALLIAGTLERLLIDRLERDLEAQARLIAGQVADELAVGDGRTVGRILTLVDSETTARAVVVDANGRVVGASEVEQRTVVGQQNEDADLAAALHGETVRGVLPRSGPQSEILYVALPVERNRQVVGAVRLAYQLRDISGTIDQLNLGIAAGALATALVAAALAAGFANALTTPIRALARATQALAAGNFEQRLMNASDDEVGQLVDVFNEASARLREYEIARQEFAADISHELHALAGAMQTAAQALEQGADREPALRDRLVAGLVGHTDRLGRLADDLLELARLEGGRLTLALEPVLLGQVARQAVAEWSAEASRRQIVLDLSVTGDPIVRGDFARLVQACGNLVENALKYTPIGGEVQIRVRAGEESHHLEVRDTGQGIPAEELPFIFHRFYRVEGRTGGGPAGMGLGLAIVDRIVRAHRGSVTVTSTPGEGSSFHIRLPAALPTAHLA
ncbi:MAG: HAMP domain-containing protein [Chloroflexi bacterium]|nr:HAMP domain-containing protein [Chloroflexota bacterium]